MTTWTKTETGPGRDVYTAKVGELNAVLTVTPLRDHPTRKETKTQHMSITFSTTVRNDTDYTNAMLAQGPEDIVEETVLRTADGWVGHLKRSMGPDMEVPMVAKYLMEEVSLGDMVYTVKSRAIESDYKLPKWQRHNGEAWTHPKVLRFNEMLQKVRGWIK